MRLILIALPVTALTACTAPTPQAVPNTVATPFDVPMDPGAIQCSSLSNPTALAAARDWTMGQARAAALSGRTTTAPTNQDLSSALAGFCAENNAATVRAAARQLGY